MSESKLEKMILYIVVFILIGVLLTLILWIFTTFEIDGATLSSSEWGQFVISLLGMVATFGAAFAALMSANAAKKSLEEQSENNKRAIMPYIVIEEKEFKLEYKNTNGKYFDLNWDNTIHRLRDRYFSGGSFLDVVNISNGNARDIKVKIVIEGYKKFINQINEHVEGINIEIGDHEYRKDSKAIKLDVKQEGVIVISSSSSSIDYQLNNFIDEEFLFITSGGGRNRIRIPDAFLVLYNIYFDNYDKISDDKISFDQFPYLIFNMSYKDITGAEYYIKYKVQFKSLSIEMKYGSIGDIKKVTLTTTVLQI